jgi:hypothetical protein
MVEAEQHHPDRQPGAQGTAETSEVLRRVVLQRACRGGAEQQQAAEAQRRLDGAARLDGPTADSSAQPSSAKASASGAPMRGQGTGVPVAPMRDDGEQERDRSPRRHGAELRDRDARPDRQQDRDGQGRRPREARHGRRPPCFSGSSRAFR